MAYSPIKHQSNIEIKQQITDHAHLHNLQMYIVPPSGYIKLEELYRWSINRLRVLKLVEQISIQSYKKSFKQCQTTLIRELENNDLIKFMKLINIPSHNSTEDTKQFLRRNDSMSHFILRSAFCLDYKKKEWFYKQEVRLFKWRLFSLNKEDIKIFNYINGFQFPSISKEERQEIKDLEIFYSITENIDSIDFYKVYFTNVIKLVSKRQVFLKNGIAYVPETKIFWIILYEFKKKLNDGFAYSREIVSNVYGDERITKIFSILRNYVNMSRFKRDRRKRIFINELDELSQKSYPLCMRLLHEALRKNHHLTNGGRVQYCLFLKGIGLRANDALRFWKSEFTKKINKITFEKEYKYFIRHLYGQEGKRANYEPFNCFKIFNSKVGLRDNHGCPFKCMTLDLLKDTLSECGLVQSDIKLIMELSKNGSYLGACKMYYEITHNCITDRIIDHPNVYFNCSRNTLK